MVIVVVGSRCQVRNRVAGLKAKSSAGFRSAGLVVAPAGRVVGVVALKRLRDARAASEAPRNARRVVDTFSSPTDDEARVSMRPILIPEHPRHCWRLTSSYRLPPA